MSEHVDRLTLEAYADKALPAALRQMVEVHLADCPICQARLTGAQQMSVLLSRMPLAQPAPGLAARINAAIAAQRAPATSRWMRALVPATFVAGLALLMLTAPEWGSRAQTAIAQLPTGEVLATWLVNLATDPAIALESLMTLVEQMIIGTTELSALLTLATVLLAGASVAGLAQLLGERPGMVTTEMSA